MIADPYDCAPGVYGRPDAPQDEQGGPSCSDLCPAGKVSSNAKNSAHMMSL